ncbi:MAG: glycosyltransferase family 39 protein, partial [Caldilineaceae bacterium]|nr:glycosyltransferase family 39 protein [Caldilineaceae bacterium]
MKTLHSRSLAGWLRMVMVVALLAAFALRLQALTRQDIWWDEARNIDVALRPFLQIPTAPELDIQPPFYYWLLHFWTGLFGVAAGQPPAMVAFFSRLLSVFAGTVGVALLLPLGRRAGSPAAGVMAALIGALSPFWLAESQETRMYTAGFALLAAAAIMLLASMHVSPERRFGRALFSVPSLLFVVLSAAALLTHYNAVFILVAWYAWWAVWALLRSDRRRAFLAVVVHGLLMTLIVLPVAPIALRQIPGYANPNLTIPAPADYLWQNWQAYVGGYAAGPDVLFGYGTTWLWTILAVASLGVVVAVATAWPLSSNKAGVEKAAGSARLDVTTISFLLNWLAGGLLLYYIAVLDRNAFNVRYSSFVTPALYALMGIGLAALGRWWRLLPVLATVAVLAGLWPAAQADLYDSRFDREHIGEVTAWLRANTQPGDMIFVDQKYPFGFYYEPYAIEESAQLSPAPVPARYLFVDINTLDSRLRMWARSAQRIFWVQWFESDTDPRRAVHFLLDKYGQRVGEQWFQGYSVDWWEMSPPTDFVLSPDMAPRRLRFDTAVQTVELSIPTGPLMPGRPLPVVIRWQRVAGGTAGQPLKARVALYSAEENRIVQADERLLNDRHLAPAQWQDEDRPLNVYLLPLPEDLQEGEYSL